MSHRKEQVASTLHRAIQQVLARGLNDPRIRGLVTVTEVNVPSDLKTATVMISVLPEERQHLTLQGIQDAHRHIRRQVGEIMAMKQIPELHFKLDLSLKRQAQAMNAIARAAADRENPSEHPETESETSPRPDDPEANR